MDQSRIHLAAVENADKRLKERPNTIRAWADYDAGLIQGFKDGAEWMSLNKMTVEQLDLSALRSRVAITKDIVKGLEPENSNLKRHLEWMQETIGKLHVENIERDFGKRGDGIKDLKKGIKAFLMANGRYAGSSETAQILREIADEWDD